MYALPVDGQRKVPQLFWFLCQVPCRLLLENQRRWLEATALNPGNSTDELITINFSANCDNFLDESLGSFFVFNALRALNTSKLDATSSDIWHRIATTIRMVDRKVARTRRACTRTRSSQGLISICLIVGHDVKSLCCRNRDRDFNITRAVVTS